MAGNGTVRFPGNRCAVYEIGANESRRRTLGAQHEHLHANTLGTRAFTIDSGRTNAASPHIDGIARSSIVSRPVAVQHLDGPPRSYRLMRAGTATYMRQNRGCDHADNDDDCRCHDTPPARALLPCRSGSRLRASSQSTTTSYSHSVPADGISVLTAPDPTPAILICTNASGAGSLPDCALTLIAVFPAPGAVAVARIARRWRDRACASAVGGPRRDRNFGAAPGRGAAGGRPRRAEAHDPDRAGLVTESSLSARAGPRTASRCARVRRASAPRDSSGNL